MRSIARNISARAEGGAQRGPVATSPIALPQSSVGLPTVRCRARLTAAAVTGRSKEICWTCACPASRYSQMRRLISMPGSPSDSSLGLPARAGRRHVTRHPAQGGFHRLPVLESYRSADQDIPTGSKVGQLPAHLFDRHADGVGNLRIEALAVPTQVLQNSAQSKPSRNRRISEQCTPYCAAARELLQSHCPATVIRSIRMEPHCLDPRTTRSLPTETMPRNMSFRLPAIVISCTGWTISPRSTQYPAAPRE